MLLKYLKGGSPYPPQTSMIRYDVFSAGTETGPTSSNDTETGRHRRVFRTQIRNTRPEARNKYKIRILKCSKRNYSKGLVRCFGHLDFGDSNLFRISIFGFRIYTPCVPLWLPKKKSYNVRGKGPGICMTNSVAVSPLLRVTASSLPRVCKIPLLQR